MQESVFVCETATKAAPEQHVLGGWVGARRSRERRGQACGGHTTVVLGVGGSSGTSKASQELVWGQGQTASPPQRGARFGEQGKNHGDQDTCCPLVLWT